VAVEKVRIIKFYVYLDFTNDGEVFYVGKGNESRCLYKKRNWLHSIVCEEEGFNRIIVFESENEQECFDKEIELIKEYHTFFRDSLSSDTASNFTQGGDGQAGLKHSEETKRFLSQLSKITSPIQNKIRVENGTHNFLGPNNTTNQWKNHTQNEYENRCKNISIAVKCQYENWSEQDWINHSQKTKLGMDKNPNVKRLIREGGLKGIRNRTKEKNTESGLKAWVTRRKNGKISYKKSDDEKKLISLNNRIRWAKRRIKENRERQTDREFLTFHGVHFE